MMSVVNLILFQFFIFNLRVCLSTSIKSRCGSFEVCNVIHNRYWLPNLIEPQCMCRNNANCSTTYSKSDNPFAMNVNSRTQMQLCQTLSTPTLPSCSINELSVQQTSSSRSNRIKTKINCMCNRRSFLKFYSKLTKRRNKSIIFKYRCVLMSKCHSNQLCGYARSDLGFVYQKCSCPEGFNCVTTSSTETLNGKMHQLFYNGTVYPAHCISFA